MNLTEMLAMVRKDLHDEDPANYQWTDDVLYRHIAHAVKILSEAIPLEQKIDIATTSGSREISLATLTDRIMIEAVEYPLGQFPVSYQRFALWGETLYLLGEAIPDGSNCCIYYGKLHSLTSQASTIPSQYEELVAIGACGNAAIEMAGYAINQVNNGGTTTPLNWSEWGKARLDLFRSELKRLGRRNKVKVKQLYSPEYPIVSKTTDWGP